MCWWFMMLYMINTIPTFIYSSHNRELIGSGVFHGFQTKLLTWNLDGRCRIQSYNCFTQKFADNVTVLPVGRSFLKWLGEWTCQLRWYLLYPFITFSILDNIRGVVLKSPILHDILPCFLGIILQISTWNLPEVHQSSSRVLRESKGQR